MKMTFLEVDVARRRFCLLALVASAAFLGCGGGPDLTAPPKPDENAAKRQQEMTDFYNKKPLPKPKAK